MKCLDDHHKYELDAFEGEGKHHLTFIRKMIDLTPGVKPGTLVTIHDGTTNEEVLRMLIHRLTAMGNLFPCRQNSLAVTKLEEALMWLEHRTAERKARGVEGKALA